MAHVTEDRTALGDAEKRRNRELRNALFQPLRGLLQRAVNRLMYGESDAPYQVLAHLDQQLALAMPPEDVLPALVKTIATTLKLPYAAVALVQSDAPTLSEAVCKVV